MILENKGRNKLVKYKCKACGHIFKVVFYFRCPECGAGGTKLEKVEEK